MSATSNESQACADFIVLIWLFTVLLRLSFIFVLC